MPNPIHVRSRARDAGLAAVNRWTRRAVAGGVVLSGLLAASLAHLLPGQAAAARHDSTAPAGTTSPSTPTTGGSDDSDDSTEHAKPTKGTSRLAPPSSAPRPSHHSSPHVTSGGS